VYHHRVVDVMRASRLVERGRIEVDGFPVPAPGPGEVLLRTHQASICGSDVHVVFSGREVEEFPYPPGAPGHESVGEVLESRSERHAAGDLVLATPVPGVSFAFADRQVVRDAFLVPLPEGADVETALMAQQLGTVIFALKRFWQGPAAETAVVIGAGSAGLHFTQLLHRSGFGRIVVADRHRHRLAAAGALGAAATVLAPGESVVEAALDLTGGRGADMVVEAAGRNATRVQALRAVAGGGRVGYFGLPERGGDMAFPFGEVFRRRPTIEVAAGAQLEPGLASFREAVARLTSGELDVSRLVTHRLPIERLPEAFGLAHEGAGLKVAISFD
jgi:L-iditol 2-dehydrogenase